MYAGKPALAARMKGGYLHGRIKGKLYQSHRIIWKLTHGYEPEYIDHINGITSDNRIANLRNVSHQENCKNTYLRKNNKSGCMGVRKVGKHWIAEIRADGVRQVLGTFDSIQHAIKARRKAEAENGYHKDHGRPTPPKHIRH